MLDKLREFAGRGRELLSSNHDMDIRLSIPEAQTTTIDGDVGWNKRPPAVLECPQCGGEFFQHQSIDDIDCPRCTAEFSHSEFTELDLLYMQCPVCHNEMDHGRRHPNRFDVPEYASCGNCRYHWELDHF